MGSINEVRTMNKPAGSCLEFAVERGSDIIVVQCSGKLVAGVNDHFYREVGALIPGSQRIVLDLAALTHMDSSGIGTLVRLYVSAKSSGCALQLRNIGKPVRQLLGVTHLIDVLAIVGENNIKFG
jgi:anti-sigma B factor antagonist